jgi:hypothetical protein
MFNRNITEIKSSFKNVVKRGTGQNSTQRTSRWQVKQGQHKLIMAKMVGQYYASSFVGTFRQITLSFLIVVVHKPSTVNNNIMVQMLPGRF